MWEFILARPWIWIPAAGVLLIDAIYNIRTHHWGGGPVFKVLAVIFLWIIIPVRVVWFVLKLRAREDREAVEKMRKRAMLGSGFGGW